jgi:hypothetical protein
LLRDDVARLEARIRRMEGQSDAMQARK